MAQMTLPHIWRFAPWDSGTCVLQCIPLWLSIRTSHILLLDSFSRIDCFDVEVVLETSDFEEEEGDYDDIALEIASH